MVAHFRLGLLSVAVALLTLAGVGIAQGQPPQMQQPPRGSQPGMPPAGSMQMMEWECKTCKHTWTTAANATTPTRCPSCKVTFTTVTNPDGTTSTTGQGWIKWIVGGIVLVFSIGGSILRKMLGNS
ncbi:MAG: zinc-ribbon domain-containing protein [Fimbriiglobus sp.]